MSTTTDTRPVSKSTTKRSNYENSRPVSEASPRPGTRGSAPPSRGGGGGDGSASPRKPYRSANKIYRCPPTPEPQFFQEREKSFVLDNVAMSSVEYENNLMNPKMGTVIPPYNSHYDRHPRAYFKFASVDKLLQRTKQNKGSPVESSVMGTRADHIWREGYGAHYLKLRNYEFPSGRTEVQLAGPGKYFNRPHQSFFWGAPDQAFGRHFVPARGVLSYRGDSRAASKTREGSARPAQTPREGSSRKGDAQSREGATTERSGTHATQSGASTARSSNYNKSTTSGGTRSGSSGKGSQY